MARLLAGLVATTALISGALAETLKLAYENGYFLDEGLFVTLEAQANWKVLLDGVID